MNRSPRSPGPRATRRPRASERGFALLVLLGIVGMGSLTIVLAVQRVSLPWSVRATTVDQNLATAQSAARIGFRRNGAFPTNLNLAATAGGLETQGAWRRDPWGAAQDLDWAIIGTGVRVRSRGTDGVLGNADDEQFVVGTETQLRGRQRARLRLLRAQLLRSPYRFSAGMSAAVRAQMITAMRTVAIGRRQWLTADAATRVTLTTQSNAAAATITALCATYGLPPLPASLTGAGGLMQMLGTSDARAVDGAGAAMRTDPNLGMAARGADGTGGTDDDM